MRLIDADALLSEAMEDGAYGYVDAKQIADAPTIDAVPRKAFDGILWENDMMRKQLADIGKSFGEKMDDMVKVVWCKDCKYNDACFTQSFVESEGVLPFDRSTWYCADGERKE